MKKFLYFLGFVALVAIVVFAVFLLRQPAEPTFISENTVSSEDGNVVLEDDLKIEKDSNEDIIFK